MKNSIRNKTLKELASIPGVGPSIAADLLELGYRTVAALKGQSPEEMYERSNKKAGKTIDRCLLYTYRCAVYYASHKKHDPKKLLWWNHMDKKRTAKK